jgi:hypothetical protein
MHTTSLRPMLGAALAAALFLSSCVALSGSGVNSPLFSANFRAGSSFPHLEPFDNVLLVDVFDAVDRLTPEPTLRLRIDGTQVYTQTVTQSGRIEVTFPPAAWSPSVGEHEVEIELSTVVRTLPFSWHD